MSFRGTFSVEVRTTLQLNFWISKVRSCVATDRPLVGFILPKRHYLFSIQVILGHFSTKSRLWQHRTHAQLRLYAGCIVSCVVRNPVSCNCGIKSILSTAKFTAHNFQLRASPQGCSTHVHSTVGATGSGNTSLVCTNHSP